MEEPIRRIRRPGSVRLSDEQYEEMHSLGIDNESAYVKYKLGNAKQHLTVIKQDSSDQVASEKNTISKQGSNLEEQLAIQRLEFQNQQLQEKLNQLSLTKDQALNGIHTQVGNLLKDELQRRDFDQLKKESASQKKELEKLEKALDKSEQEKETKEAEIKDLLKKLGIVELGKTLLPSAISGLAKKFPTQMQGLASTLGALSMGEEENTPINENSLNEEQQNLLQIATYFKELFSESQFEQMVQLVIQIGEGIQLDNELLKKVSYYLNKIQPSKTIETK